MEISKIIETYAWQWRLDFQLFKDCLVKSKQVANCLMTPDYKSRYCSLHKPRVCQKPVNDIDDIQNFEEDIAEMIIE